LRIKEDLPDGTEKGSIKNSDKNLATPFLSKRQIKILFREFSLDSIALKRGKWKKLSRFGGKPH